MAFKIEAVNPNGMKQWMMRSTFRYNTRPRGPDGDAPLPTEMDTSGIAIFRDGALAALWAKTWNDQRKASGDVWRFRVRPYLTPEETEEGKGWREREQKRLADGTYTPAPEISETFWFKESAFIHLHYPHLSQKKEEKGMLAYTPSEEMGIMDKQVPIKLGRYLNKFFSDILSPPMIADICAAMGVEDDDYEIKFAKSAAAIRRVYVSGPTSCMAHKTSEFNKGKGLPYHPVDGYATGDIEVAYLEQHEESGKRITARAVANPRDKTYGRVYGDNIRFASLMAKLGWSHDPNCLNGLRIKRIVWNNQYIMPYLDGQGALRREGDYLVIDRHGHIARAGGSGVGAMPICQRCRDPDTDKERLTSYADGHACKACGAKGKRCDLCGGHYLNQQYMTPNRAKTVHWCVNCMAGHGLLCDYCGIYHHREDMAGQTIAKHPVCIQCAADRHMVKQPGCLRWLIPSDGKQECGCNACRHERAEAEKAAAQQELPIQEPTQPERSM